MQCVSVLFFGRLLSCLVHIQIRREMKHKYSHLLLFISPKFTNACNFCTNPELKRQALLINPAKQQASSEIFHREQRGHRTSPFSLHSGHRLKVPTSSRNTLQLPEHVSHGTNRAPPQRMQGPVLRPVSRHRPRGRQPAPRTRAGGRPPRRRPGAGRPRTPTGAAAVGRLRLRRRAPPTA